MRSARMDTWPEKVLTMQRNWIGRSDGRARAVSRSSAVERRQSIEVFTTRIDTIYGATFVLLAPEHPLVERFARRVARSGGLPRGGREVPRAGSHRAAHRRSREGRVRHRPRGDESVHEHAGPDLGRELRARRIRHRRGDGRARPRPARLRVRDQIRPADSDRRRSGVRIGAGRRVVRRRRARSSTPGRTPACSRRTPIDG